MAKEKNATSAPLLRSLFQLSVYKRSQGKIARQVNFAAMAVVIFIGGWQLYATMGLWHVGRWFGATPENLDSLDRMAGLGICCSLVLIGLWIAYRLVNMPNFADFLIAVEAEMNKVSWPTRVELVRSSIVVIFLIVFLSLILFGYDLFWRELLDMLGVVNVGG